ncbi:uncharacterized protein BP5553_00221 [Venustampulla echinocandica]|uniref:Uncharacterized protein n=1 Tax=Venustampulla echinocandica TaxID=2656787 RepID=A0A370TXI9_9HELO|nr:uncharacterized protein BP5553_00221 [Venustampulla echinocandica]RDL40242.1 hypothetical protein BP5553_00221 [Venustampulla echinocandica]
MRGSRFLASGFWLLGLIIGAVQDCQTASVALRLEPTWSSPWSLLAVALELKPQASRIAVTAHREPVARRRLQAGAVRLKSGLVGLVGARWLTGSRLHGCYVLVPSIGRWMRGVIAPHAYQAVSVSASAGWLQGEKNPASHRVIGGGSIPEWVQFNGLELGKGGGVHSGGRNKVLDSWTLGRLLDLPLGPETSI